LQGGHEHFLERSEPEAGGTQYVVSGAGSRLRDNALPTPEQRL
jgi:hypothetical protein